MTPQLDADQVARVVIPYFLRSLMRIERERVGLAQREASTNAGWSASLWGSLERGDRHVDRDQWITAAGVLSLSSADIVRRLNAFIHKYPSLWLERVSTTTVVICERPVTSPRIIRSGKVVNVDLVLHRFDGDHRVRRRLRLLFLETGYPALHLAEGPRLHLLR